MAEGQGSLKLYVLSRLLLTAPMLLILLTFVFIVLRVAPGDPVLAVLGQHATPETIKATREALGFDQPLYVQYFDYLWGVLHGDLGTSYIISGVSTWSIIRDSFPATLELTLAATLVAVLVGLPVGAIAGARRNSATDVTGRTFGIVVYAAPIFWLGVMAILIFSTYLGWLPSGGRLSGRTIFAYPFERRTGLFLIDAAWAGQWPAFWDALEHLILPATTLGLVISGIFVRMTRVNMLQTMQADYVEAARARGIRERVVVFRHAFKNALVPVITIVGMTFALLLSGAVLTETVFNWPGLGRAFLNALENRDFPVIQGIVTFFALIVVFVSIAIDILNAYVDPRIRY